MEVSSAHKKLTRRCSKFLRPLGSALRTELEQRLAQIGEQQNKRITARLRRAGASSTTGAKRDQAAADAAECPIPRGIHGLDTELGLARMSGKKSLYLEMLRRYINGQKNVCAQVQLELARGDMAAAERLPHTT